MKTMALAVAGAGALGRRWSEVLGGLPEVEVKAVVDPLVGGPHAPAWPADHPGIEKFSSLDLLPSGRVEAVLVTASSPAHYEAVKKGLELGLHVLVKKPFATSLEDARTLVGLAQQRGLTLMVSQNYRFFPGVQALRELVRTGELGAVCAVTFLYSGSLVSKAPRVPWGGHWRFEFARATLFAEKIEGQYLLFRRKEDGIEAIAPFGDNLMAFGHSFRHFFKAVREETEPWCSGRDNLGTLEMALAFNGLPDRAAQATDLSAP